uniref:Uncharacterized protein n=1 Tax=Oryza punctata TaxID=4537 RepID=A0A0E0L403_ORYPU
MAAFGCGELGQALVDGLTLYARLGGSAAATTSSPAGLAVGSTDEALLRIKMNTIMPAAAGQSFRVTFSSKLHAA